MAVDGHGSSETSEGNLQSSSGLGLVRASLHTGEGGRGEGGREGEEGRCKQIQSICD